MKKKLLLALLPAVLVLSACNGGAQKEKVNVENDFLEDTLAHEEIFGSVEKTLQPKRLGGQNLGSLRFEDPELDPELDPDVVNEHPSIGVQSFYDDVNNKVSFRFVAVVHFNSVTDRELSSAVWTRSVSKVDGSEYPLDYETSSAPSCTTAYKKLSNGTEPYTIEKYNSDHGGTNYTHFVVYTLRNIDLSKYAGSDYFVSAYLSMSGNVGNVNSKAIAIRFDGNKKYTYVHDLGKYYITGSFTANPIDAKTTREHDYDLDKATFDPITLNSGDTFVINEFVNSKLYIHGSNGLKGKDNTVRHYFEPTSGKAETIFNGGTYSFSLNKYDEIWATVTGTVLDSERYLYYSTNSGAAWWPAYGCWTAVWAYGGSGPDEWITFTYSDGFYKSDSKIDVSKHTTYIFVRMNGQESKSPAWSNEEQRIENVPNSAASTSDCAYICQDGGSPYVSWGSRSY